MYYDRQGNPITYEQFGKLFNPEYARVAEDTVHGFWVSTVWLGVDHGWSGDGKPIIFETMVFPGRNDLSDICMERYSTEEEAIEGHKRMCKMVRSFRFRMRRFSERWEK